MPYPVRKALSVGLAGWSCPKATATTKRKALRRCRRAPEFAHAGRTRDENLFEPESLRGFADVASNNRFLLLPDQEALRIHGPQALAVAQHDLARTGENENALAVQLR
jgi:hypothetical protein